MYIDAIIIIFLTVVILFIVWNKKNNREYKAMVDRVTTFINDVKDIEDGYEGLAEDGRIVDRRKHPEATPIGKNPKKVTLKNLDLDCSECDYLVQYLDEDKWGKVCGKCGRDMSVFWDMDV